jgi:hypothetical protein
VALSAAKRLVGKGGPAMTLSTKGGPAMTFSKARKLSSDSATEFRDASKLASDGFSYMHKAATVLTPGEANKKVGTVFLTAAKTASKSAADLDLASELAGKSASGVVWLGHKGASLGDSADVISETKLDNSQKATDKKAAAFFSGASATLGDKKLDESAS